MATSFNNLLYRALQQFWTLIFSLWNDLWGCNFLIWCRFFKYIQHISKLNANLEIPQRSYQTAILTWLSKWYILSSEYQPKVCDLKFHFVAALAQAVQAEPIWMSSSSYNDSSMALIILQEVIPGKQKIRKHSLSELLP